MVDVLLLNIVKRRYKTKQTKLEFSLDISDNMHSAVLMINSRIRCIANDQITLFEETTPLVHIRISRFVRNTIFLVIQALYRTVLFNEFDIICVELHLSLHSIQ